MVADGPDGAADQNCPDSGSIRKFDGSDTSQYTYSIIDACSVSTDVGPRVNANGSDSSWVDLNNESGEYVMTFGDPFSGNDSAPAPVVSDAGELAWTSNLNGQAFKVTVEEAVLRDSNNNDLPE